MAQISFRSLITRWFYQEKQWSWQYIEPFLRWQENVAWSEVPTVVHSLSPEELAVLWRWDQSGFGERSCQQKLQDVQAKDFFWSQDKIDHWAADFSHGEWRWYTPWDAVYPTRFRSLEDPPPVIWCSQPLEEWSVLEGFTVAVVGSRRATPYGKRATQEFVQTLVEISQVPIISGGAYGIDAQAHASCLASGGQTVALLPHGCRQVPKRLESWLAQENFLAVTEFPPTVAVKRWHFVQRNRLIAGAAAAVLVMEAAKRSGTFLTAAAAFLQGKEVFVLTQPRHSPQVEGIFSLVENGAHLVAEPAHMWPHLSGHQPKLFANDTQKVQKKIFKQFVLSPLEKAILQSIQQSQGSLLNEQCRQQVQSQCEQPSDWPKALLHLELQGYIRQELGVLQLTADV